LLVTIGGAAATRALSQSQGDAVTQLEERAKALEEEITKMKTPQIASPESHTVISDDAKLLISRQK
jgi:hypothetical protein